MELFDKRTHNFSSIFDLIMRVLSGCIWILYADVVDAQDWNLKCVCVMEGNGHWTFHDRYIWCSSPPPGLLLYFKLLLWYKYGKVFTLIFAMHDDKIDFIIFVMGLTHVQFILFIIFCFMFRVFCFFSFCDLLFPIANWQCIVEGI